VPHAVIEGEIDLAAFAREFEPLLIREGRDVLRAEEVYLGQDERALLMAALVIERGRKQSFYVRLSSHDRGSVTVRVDPVTHPERSRGVRALVTRIVEDLLERNPRARLGATNLVLPSPSGGAT